MAEAEQKKGLEQRKLLPPLLLIGLNVFVFTPFTLYHGSPREFEASYLDIGSLLALGFLTFIGIGLFIGSQFIRTTEAGRQRVLALLFGFGLLLWIQSSFMMWQYGDLDGRGIDWQNFAWQGYLDAAVWLTVLTLCYLRPAIWIGLVGIGSIALICMQSALMFTKALNSEEPLWSDPPKKFAQGPPADHFYYSSTLNIVHILLDSFQSDVFLELVEEEGLANDFEGFTLFFDNASVSSSTTFSLPAIFTGVIYNGSMPFTQYYDDSIGSGIADRLFDLGYSVRLTPTISMYASRSSSYFPTPNHYTSNTGSFAFHDAVFLFDVSLFRQSPHFLRKLVYNENNWVLSSLLSKSPNEVSFQQKSFFTDYIDKISIQGKAPAYHFMHLRPPHPPYVTLPDGSSAGKPLPSTRVNFKNEARYILRIFVSLLERLKALGLYDSSLIVLQGDHGSIFEPIVEGVAKSGLPVRTPALLTVKPPNAHGALELSHVPSNVADVAATIEGLLDLERTFQGTSVFELGNDPARERYYVSYQGGKEDPELLRRKLVGGSLYESANWSVVDQIQVAQEAPEQYQWGEPIQFGIEGNATPYLGIGWDDAGLETWLE